MTKILDFEHVYTLIQQGKREGWDAFHVAPNFTWGEVFGSMQGREWGEITTGQLESAQAFARDTMQAIRDKNGPLIVTSWLRPRSYNARVGGAAASQHLYGEAVDFYPINTSLDAMYASLDASHGGGLAMNPGSFIHIDGRSWKARWTY